MDGEVVKQVMAAAMAGLPADMESARLKLGKGQSLTDVKDDAGKTALHVAAERGHVDLVRHLVDAEFSNVDAHRDAQGNTALGLAVAANQASTAEELIKSGADTGAHGPHGPMLVSACSLGHTAVARALLQAGADPNARSLDGMPGIFMSAAMAAMKLKIPGRETEAQGSLECLEALLSSGADPNVSAPGGFTPLHVAAEAGSDRMVRALLAAGASTAAKTSAGQTPAAVAATWGHRSLAEALLRHESGPDGVSAQSVDALMAEAEAHAAAQIAARSAAASNSDPATSAGVPQPEDPDDAKSEALKAEGNKAFVAGEFETALAKYHAALRHCTTSPLVWANAAAAALRLGRHAEALKDARVARTLDPTNVKAWYREGQAAEGLGLWEDAAAAYFEAYLVQPGGIGGLDFGAMVKAAVEKGRAAAQGKGS